MHLKDGKAKLPALSKDLSRPIFPDCYSTRPIASSATSSSSTSSTSPDFIIDVQAAFKRHRPLCPPQSNKIRPMRMIPPQREVSRCLASKIDGHSSQNIPSGDVHGHKYSVSLIKNKTSVGGDIPRNPCKSLQRNNEASSLLVNNHYTRETGPFLEEKVYCKQGSDCPTDTVKLSSHLGSLALTEIEWEVRNPPDASTVINPDIKPSNYNTETEANISHMDGGEFHSLLSKRPTDGQDQLNEFQKILHCHASHPITQSSMVGSCVTSSLINSSSAPMISSTKDCFQSHPESSQLGKKYYGDLDPNPQHITEGCVTSSSLIHSSSAPLVTSTTNCLQSLPEGSSHLEIKLYGDLDANPQPITQDEILPGHLSDSAAAQSSSSAIDTQRKNPSSMGQHNCNSSKEPSPIDAKLNQGKGSDCGIKPQAPILEKSSSDVKLESSKSIKEEKAVIPKGASVPRKRSHDPDLFFRVNGKLYQRLGKIGSGGSSEVHKVISSDCTIYALKKIKLKGRDYATAYGFCQEIEYLNKLKGKNYIIQLIDYEVTDKTLLQDVLSGSFGNKDGKFKDDGFIYMLLEYGEIDLSRMLSLKWEELDGSGQLIDENWLRFYWQQILLAVNTIHEERIVHSDLKPANFLLVKGSLKLIDFGIAKSIMNDTTHIQRDLQVGTLSYMSPEAFMCNESDKKGGIIKCGRPSDIWSLGCILYQMVYGRTPFSEYKNFWSKFQVITNPNHAITYDPLPNPWLLDLMHRCLSWDMNQRWRIPELLKHPFLAPPMAPATTTTQILHSVGRACGNDEGTLRLYNHLNELMLEHEHEEKYGCCELLSEISKCCLQIRRALSKSEEIASE